MDNNDNALRDADDNIQSSHELGYFISYQVLHGQLKVAQKKIKKLEQENAEWKDLLGRLKDFKEWKRWKIGEG